MQRIERFGLRLRYGWDVARARQGLEAREAAARILDQDAFGLSVGRCGLVEEERTEVVGLLGVAKSTLVG